MPNRRLALFCRQMANLLGAGVPLSEALRTASSSLSGRLKSIISSAANLIQQGIPLKIALRPINKLPPVFFVNMVNIGEQTGSLEKVFSYLADYYEKMFILIRRTLSWLIWPAIQL
ncbi:MAG: type II secretion system F family protein [bacterium]